MTVKQMVVEGPTLYLERGNLLPLSKFAHWRDRTQRQGAAYQSGDKSPHSTLYRDTLAAFQKLSVAGFALELTVLNYHLAAR
jgi:hypothetical protein